MFPNNFASFRIWIHFTGKINIITLFYLVLGQIWSQLQPQLGRVWNLTRVSGGIMKHDLEYRIVVIYKQHLITTTLSSLVFVNIIILLKDFQPHDESRSLVVWDIFEKKKNSRMWKILFSSCLLFFFKIFRKIIEIRENMKNISHSQRVQFILLYNGGVKNDGINVKYTFQEASNYW